MHRLSICTVATCVMLAGLSCSKARAEAPQAVYARFQAEAPESITVRIERVVIRQRMVGNDLIEDVTALAEITDVERSATELVPENCIRINYRRTKRSVPFHGPSEVPIVQEGKTYPAFLKWDDNKQMYAPAAGGYTFHKATAKRTVVQRHRS